MGQKINPLGFRLGHWRTWDSRWFARQADSYQKNLIEDHKIRQYLMKKLELAGIVRVEIERYIKKAKITLYVSRPGVVIGSGGTGLEKLKKKLDRLISIPEPEKNLKLDVIEVKKPELKAQIVLSQTISQLERRMPHRRVVNKMMDRVMAAGALGVKIVLSGRVAGAEISRTEKYSRGKIPLQTLRAKIDYAQRPALTKFGFVGVKVWIYTGEE